MTDIHVVRTRLRMVLKKTVLEGSDRDVPNATALGEEGVGLDSLALVQFLTALEQEFGIELPIDMWSDAGGLSIDDCAVALDRLDA